MMIALSILLGVAFWVWVYDEVSSDDDDSADATEQTSPTEASVNEGENDLLIGTEGEDSLDGAEGADILYGDEGDDSLRGGEGDDLILGGADDDLLTGSEGDDAIIGGEGADTMIGHSGSDFLDGTSLLDEDALVASAQTATDLGDLDFQYGSGPDTDEGDSIEGRGGEDWILMGSDDSVSGGADSDLFEGGDWVRPGEPAIIEDYDATEDVIAYTYEGPTAPTITTSIDAATGDATVYADGDEVIVVINAGPSFNSGNVMLIAA